MIVAADSDLFGDDVLGEFDHLQLWLNLLYWVALPAFRAEPEPLVSAARHDVAWERLRDETDALRALQEPKGEVDLTRHDAAEVAAHVAAMTEAIGRLGGYFPHQQDYLAQVAVDLRRWLDEGCGKPDFTASLAALSPRAGRDATASSTWSCSPCTRPTARPTRASRRCIVRTPWPEFIDRLERERLRQRKVRAGAARRPHRGLRRRVRRAVPRDGERRRTADQLLRRHLLRPRIGALSALDRSAPPRPCASTCRPTPPPWWPTATWRCDIYVLWDMIHDRWHSHGDLPFDPFMIRQRLPYWMYSLEELRVDLATYGTVGELARDGFPFARYMKYGDALRPHPALSDHRQPGAQLRRPGRPVAVRLPASRRRRALDRQPSADRLGARRRRRGRAQERSRRPLPPTAST